MHGQTIIDKYRPLILTYKIKYPMLKILQLTGIIKKEEKIPHTIDAFRKVVTQVFNESVKTEPISLEDPEEDEFLLPRSDYKDVPFFRLPKSCDNILVLADIHIPYHSSKPLILALRYGRDAGVNTIFLDGDILDCYFLSRFVMNPNMRNFKGELTLTKEFLAELRKKFPNAKIYFKLGNHEYRFYNYVFQRAPAFADIKELSFEKMLDFNLYGIEIVQFNQVTIAGKLNIIHGHELPGAGINMARNKGIKAFDNLMFAHHHFSQFYPTKTIQDKQMGSWAVGCLCGTKPDYSPINNWTNGFAHVQIESSGNFQVHNKMIIDNQIR